MGEMIPLPFIRRQETSRAWVCRIRHIIVPFINKIPKVYSRA